MEIRPEIIKKLSSEDSRLWRAAHADGSDNRINEDTILEASAYGTDFGIIAAVSQGIRMLFRNRNKSRQDLKDEKEAFRINNTCTALNEMLLEYLQAVQEGSAVDEESLDELIDTLDQMHGYYQAGKLTVPGEKELSEIRKSIEDYTAETTGSPAGQTPGADEFVRIREQLLKQKN